MVKRYIVDEVVDGYAGRVVTATHDKGGEFVKYEDYAALQADHERLLAQLRPSSGEVQSDPT